MHFNLDIMKNLIILILLFLGCIPLAKGQEIIPFPDLSESHVAVYNQTETIDDHNYSLYTKDYQVALKNIDDEIEEITEHIQNEPDVDQKTRIQKSKATLVKERSSLIQEAELLEDLNKFY